MEKDFWKNPGFWKTLGFFLKPWFCGTNLGLSRKPWKFSRSGRSRYIYINAFLRVPICLCIPDAPCMVLWYIYLYIQHTCKPKIGKYSSHVDHIGMIFRCPITRVLRLSPFLATHQHEQRWWMIPLQPFTFVWARETWKLKFDGGLQKNREYMGIYIYIQIYIYICVFIKHSKGCQWIGTLQRNHLAPKLEGVQLYILNCFER